MNIKFGNINIKNWKIGDNLYPSYYDEDDYLIKCKGNINKKDIILKPNTKYILKVDYPLRDSCKVEFNTGKIGFTREKLIDKICKLYRKIYQIEDSSSKIKSGLIPGMLNRNFTNGKFGIWGHGIGDLCLVSANISKNNVITLGVDS